MTASSSLFNVGIFLSLDVHRYYLFIKRISGNHIGYTKRHDTQTYRHIFVSYASMSETYQSKRERWQRMLESLPIDLREHVSLRNVEAVASLTSQAQERLAEALHSGLKRLPRAVEQLRINPDTSVAELLNLLLKG